MRMNEIKIVSQFLPKMERGIAYGEACFETLRVYQGKVFQCKSHQYRLQQAMAAYGWDMEIEALSQWFESSIKASYRYGDDVLMRFTVSGGDAAWGLLPAQGQQPSFYVQAMPMQKRGKVQLQSVIWPFALHEKYAKFSSDYAEGLRARQIWKSSIAGDSQALVCSNHGEVLSTLTSNIALYRQGQWHTPQGLGILKGIVREYLVQKEVLSEAVCPVSWLDDCEVMVCINSGVFVQAVSHINARVLPRQHHAYAILTHALAGESGVYIDEI